MAPPASGGGKPRRRRLSRSAEFERVYRKGRSHGNRFLVLHAFPRDAEPAADEGDEQGPRLGISVGRKVGGAVERNRVKRALREAFWELAGELPANYDFVIVGRSEVGGLVEREGTPGLQASLDEVIVESGLRNGASV